MKLKASEQQSLDRLRSYASMHRDQVVMHDALVVCGLVDRLLEELPQGAKLKTARQKTSGQQDFG